MSYHGVGADGPTDYEPSYETQPAEGPRYPALQQYPANLGFRSATAPQGIIGPSGQYSTAGFRLPRAGMGEFEIFSGNQMAWFAGGAVVAALVLNKVLKRKLGVFEGGLAVVVGAVAMKLFGKSST